MFLASTPQEDVNAVVQQTVENSKQAVLWFAVIAVVVLVVMFAGKK